MFLEKDSHNRSQGWIEVICGSMFSGKTEELIRRLKRAKIAKLKVEIFKPGVDTRYSEEDVVSHNATALHSIPVESANEILFYATDVDVIGIDEAQFLDDELPNVCLQLANQGVRVIIAGLDMDFMGNPFGPMPKLMAIAEDVTKVHAICVRCGGQQFSHRTIAGDKLVVLGETESYEPLCRACYLKARQERDEQHESAETN